MKSKLAKTLVTTTAIISTGLLSACRLDVAPGPLSPGERNIPDVVLPTPVEYTCRFRDPDVKDSNGAVVQLGANQETTLFVYDPGTEANPTTRAIVDFHAGGWAAGHREDGTPTPQDAPDPGRTPYDPPVFDALYNQGFVVITGSYRLTSLGGLDDETDEDNPVDAATPVSNQFPAQLIDAKAAMNCAKEIVGDKPVVVSGLSAGAHLALLTGLTPGLHEPLAYTAAGTTDTPGVLYQSGAVGSDNETTAAAIIALDGPMNLSYLYDDTDPAGVKGRDHVEHLLCGSPGCLAGPSVTDTDRAALLASASPITYVKSYIDVDTNGDGQNDILADTSIPIYLACGNSPLAALGEGFVDCKGNNEFYDITNYGTSDTDDPLDNDAQDKVWIQSFGGGHIPEHLIGTDCTATIRLINPYTGNYIIDPETGKYRTIPRTEDCTEIIGVNWGALGQFLSTHVPITTSTAQN